MQNVIIKELQVKNFKGFKGVREFTFDTTTQIAADNHRGKTSIAEAIVFGLCGCNLEGGVKLLDNLIHQGEKSAVVGVKFIGVDGQEHQVMRRLTARTREIVLDGAKAKQIDVDRFIGPTDMFLTAFWPANLGAMKNGAAREFFMGLIKLPTYLEVVGKLSGFYVKYLKPYEKSLYDPQGLIKEIKEEMKIAEMDNERCIGNMEAQQEILRKEVPQEVNTADLEQQLAAVNNELDTMVVTQPELTDTTELEHKLVELRLQAQNIKREGSQLGYNFNPGDLCPTCGQYVSAEHVAAVQQDLMAKTQALQVQYQQVIAEGQNVKAVLEQIKADNEVKLQEFKETFEVKRQQLHNKRNGLQNEINTLLSQKSAREQLLKQKDEAGQKILDMQNRINQNKEALEYSKVTVDAIKEYVAKQAELITDQVQKCFTKASIQLFEVTKTTGEMKPVFKLLYDNKPFEVLSTSERIRLGLEIANFVKQAIGINFPTFIDNAESITNYDIPEGQLFEAKVVEGMELTINNADFSKSA